MVQSWSWTSLIKILIWGAQRPCSDPYGPISILQSATGSLAASRDWLSFSDSRYLREMMGTCWDHAGIFWPLAGSIWRFIDQVWDLFMSIPSCETVYPYYPIVLFFLAEAIYSRKTMGYQNIKNWYPKQNLYCISNKMACPSLYYSNTTCLMGPSQKEAWSPMFDALQVFERPFLSIVYPFTYIYMYI